MKKITLAYVAAVAVVACSGKQAVQPQSALAAPASVQAPAAKAAVSMQESTGKLTGVVLESVDAAGYTYVRLKTTDGERWAAVSQAKVVRGESVTVDVQMVSEKFESKTLNRRFDAIAFGTIATPPAAMMSSAPASAPQHPMESAAQHMTVPKVASLTVPRAEGKDSKTIGELWTSRASLVGQSVTVRGKVVKFLPGIMGKNWVHLRDGSKMDASDADLTVTTDALATVGDVVVVKGKVSIDRDFGSGYRYPLIIENAVLDR